MIERPLAELVQSARSGQAAQWGAKLALPPRAPKVMATVWAAGQVTVEASRSIPKRSLVKPPVRLRAGGTLATTS